MSAVGPGRKAADDPADGEALHRAVEELLLDGGRRWTRRDIAERSGVGPERSAQIWRALGFPVVDDRARVFTDADVEALRSGERLIAAGLITEEDETMMARALGHHLSRLAEWQMRTLWTWLGRDLPEGDARGLPEDDAPALPEGGARDLPEGNARDRAALIAHAARLLPEMELLQRHVWRRHLAAHAGRVLAADDEEPSRRPARTHATNGGTGTEEAAPGGGEPSPGGTDIRHLAVGFTDMVAYTRMTRGLDSTALARVLDRFEALVGDVVAEGRGRVVKTIGDEVLFVCESAPDAAGIAWELAARAGRDRTLPRLRTGLAHGPVLNRYGDVYGAAVNIAARLTAVARPGTVLVDTAFAGELAGTTAYSLKALRPVSVRGYSRLRPVLLRVARPGGPPPVDSPRL